MVIDTHWHSRGTETPEEIARAVESAGLEKAVIFSPYRADGSGMGMQEANKWMADMAAKLPDKVIGFAWIEPTLPGAVEEVERCINDYHLRGVKMIPNHWYPCDEAIFPVYEKIQELGVPMLFHSGILYGNEDSSRFCRPAFYEALLHFPKIRFALAHVSWPWVDECLAVYGRFRAQWERYHNVRPAVQEIQMYIDITPGTPPPWREDALRKAIAFAGEDHIIWGSDASPSNWAYAKQILEGDRRIFSSQLGIPACTQEKIFGGNMAKFLERTV